MVEDFRLLPRFVSNIILDLTAEHIKRRRILILGSDSLVSPFTSIINEWSRLFNLILHSKVNYDTLLLHRAFLQSEIK